MRIRSSSFFPALVLSISLVLAACSVSGPATESAEMAAVRTEQLTEYATFCNQEDDQHNYAYLIAKYRDNNVGYVTLDEVDWLTGEEANKAMRKDGYECPQSGDCTNNGFYVRNTDKSTVTLSVADDVQVGLSYYDTAAESMALYSVSFDYFINPTRVENGNLKLVWIEKKNDTVTELCEQYVP